MHPNWGSSIYHKGIDIFKPKGTPVISSTQGIIIFTGTIRKGGNVILILGPHWKLHYYAHLDSIKRNKFSLVKTGQEIGTVGTTGNAMGKPPHLHYTVQTLIPYVWRWDGIRRGRMWYLDPSEEFSKD